MKHGIILSGLFCFAVIIGCAANNSPSSAARKFYAALEKNDTKVLGQVATDETVQTIALFGEKIQEGVKEYGKITNTTEEIDGDEATVAITFENGETEELTLAKIDGKWKVTIGK